MKNTKKIVAVIMMATIICSIFVACSRGNEREKENAVNNTVSVENNTQDITENKDKENSTEKVTDDATESASKSDEQKNEDQTVTNQQKETTTAKKQENTTKKKVETTAKKKVETTTKKKVTTTKKAVTTTKKKVTTTKAAQKNVSPKDVQKQVNAYIKSKGIPVDASRTPNNSGWSDRISRTQERLNSGKTLQICKEMVDLEIADGVDKMYCYYDSNWFYILYV